MPPTGNSVQRFKQGARMWQTIADKLTDGQKDLATENV